MHKDTEATELPELIYGVIEGSGGEGVQVLPAEEVQNLLKGQRAYSVARTWGEFRQLAPSSFVELETQAWLQNQEDEEDPGLTPGDDLEFTTGYPDGDALHLWPQALMLRLLPEKVQQQFGEVSDTTHSGPFLQIDPNHEEALIQALEAEGYALRRNDDMMYGAQGYLSVEELNRLLQE